MLGSKIAIVDGLGVGPRGWGVRFVSCLFCAFFFVGPVVGWSAEGKSVVTHGDWESRIVVSSDGKAGNAFRAVTLVALDSGRSALLMADRYRKDCKTVFLQMALTTSEAAKEGFKSSRSPVVFRVDELALHHGEFTLSTTKGESVAWVNFFDVQEAGVFLNELAVGGSLRTKFTFGEKEYFYRFPLNGYASAMRRSLSLCQSENPPSSDKDYFGSSRRPAPKATPQKPTKPSAVDNSPF
jgi:hypothetical protein